MTILAGAPLYPATDDGASSEPRPVPARAAVPPKQEEGQSDGAKPTAVQRDLANLAVRLVAAEARIESLEAAIEALKGDS